jgi:WD40 repeat protein
VHHVKNPKFEDRGYGFTSDGKFMLLAEKCECKDYIGIYFLGDWSAVNHFSVDTFDLEDARWANDTAIVVQDTCLVYQLLIYSPMGALLARHRPYDNGLGIKSLSISPNKTYLSVGSFDQSIRLFSKISWMLISELKHEPNGIFHFYKEEEYKEGYTDDRLYGRFLVLDPPDKVPSIKVPKDKPNPPAGVSCCEWSCNSQYLASRNDNNPNCLWVWKTSCLGLQALTLQTQPVKHLEWSPKSLHLAFCTGTGRLFFWSPEGASVCEVPLESKDFKVSKFKWSDDGTALLIIDKNKCMIAYPKFDILDAGNENYF